MALSKYRIYTPEEAPPIGAAAICVQGVWVGDDDFSVLGIFTKEKDAEEFMELLHTQRLVMEGTCVGRLLTWDAIIELLLHDKLGRIYELLEAKLGI